MVNTARDTNLTTTYSIAEPLIITSIAGNVFLIRLAQQQLS
jgi:hypothetical protein